MKFLSALLSLIFITSIGVAKDGQLVMTATTDADSYTTQIFVFTDTANNLTGMSFTSDDPDNPGAKASFKEFVSGQIVVKHNKDHNKDVVWLSAGADLTPTDGGKIKMTYLTNGMTGNTSTYPIEIRRVGSKWVVYSAKKDGSRAFSHMFLKANTFLGKVIGVEEIQIVD